MSNAKHTPGPWQAAEVRSDSFDNLPAHFIASPNGFPLAKLENYAGNEREANAKLIAAAPDMAEALKELISSAEMYRESVARKCSGRPSNEAINMLSAFILKGRAALAKAGVA